MMQIKNNFISLVPLRSSALAWQTTQTYGLATSKFYSDKESPFPYSPMPEIVSPLQPFVNRHKIRGRNRGSDESKIWSYSPARASHTASYLESSGRAATIAMYLAFLTA